MPYYTFSCDRCEDLTVLRRSFELGPNAFCPCACGGILTHNFLADAGTVEFDTAACRDHNFIKREKRVYRPGTQADAGRKEAAYASHVKQRRAALADGGNKGKIKQTMAIPADLYHGKVRETGDKNYWADKKNVARHSDFKVG